MKNKKKLVLQLELNIYWLLEEANKESNVLLETQCRGSEAFKASFIKYKDIYNLIQINQKNGITSDVLESYLFEAWLAKLQTKENCLTENPVNAAELLENEQKLERIRKSLETLYLRANEFFTALKSKESRTVQSSRFLFDCNETVNSINSYHSSWQYLSNRAKANYYYNFANTLVQQLKKTTENSEKMVVLKKVCYYLSTAMAFYVALEDKQSAKATKVFLKKIEFSLNNLGSPKTIKRKAAPTPVERVTKLTKLVGRNDGHREINLPYKDINEEREIVWKENVEKILEQIVVSDVPLFYSRLFFTMAARLALYIEGVNSKGGFCHTFLNRLSWLRVAINLLDLSENKAYCYQMYVLHDLKRLHKEHARNLKIISQQKRDQAYPICSSIQLEKLDLKDFFISEIFDYYYGLEALGSNYIDMVEYLDDVLTIIHASIDQEKQYLAEKSRLHEITTVVFEDKYSKHYFYAQLLRELAKFYTDPDNEAWFLSHTSLSPALIYKECVRLLEHAMYFATNAGVSDKTLNKLIGKIYALNAHLTHKINQSTPCISRGEFFKVPEKMESLQKIVEEHLDFIYQSRKCGIAIGMVCDHTLKFITVQCEKISDELRQLTASSALMLLLSNRVTESP